MILMLAPSPNIVFGAMPSGVSYTADQYGVVKVLNNSAADQAALQTAGCFTLTPFGGWGNFGFNTLANLYAADTAINLVLTGEIGFPQYTVASVFADGTGANDGTWCKTSNGNGAGNWTQVSTQTLASISAASTAAAASATSAATSAATALGAQSTASAAAVTAVSAALASGAQHIYATYAAAAAAVGSLANGAIVQVVSDSTHNNDYTIYQVVSGALSFLIDMTVNGGQAVANLTLLANITGAAGPATPTTAAALAPYLSGPVSLWAYGSGDTAWANAAAANVEIYVPPGSYTITNNHTFTAKVRFAPGAVVSAASAKTLTFNGGIDGSLSKIFGTNITAVISAQAQRVVHPEWWGAVAYASVPGSYVDSAPAINAAIFSGPLVVELQAGAYYVSETITIAIDGISLIGAGSTQLPCISTLGGPGTGNIDPAATQIILTSASAIGVLVGVIASSEPSTITQNVLCKDFTVVRATASAPLGVASATAIANPTSGFSISTTPSGVVSSWTSLCTFKNIFVIEHSVGFYIYGTVVNHFNDCRALRYTPGLNAGNDFFIGYFMNNSAPSSYNSGNASLYFNKSGAFSNDPVAGAPAYTYNGCVQSYNGFTDTYILQMESANCGYGADMNGVQTTSADYETEDLLIEACVFDGCRYAGISVQAGGPKTALQIQNNYIGCGNATGPVTSGIYLYNIHGAANVQGNQIIAGVGNPAIGLNYDLSGGIFSRGNIITDLSAPIVVTTCSQVRIEDIVTVAAVSPATAAVQVNGLTRGVIDCDIASSTLGNAIPIGVDLQGSGNSYVEVRMTNINPTHITGGSANKLVSNGTQITAVGTFSTNCLASGIAA